MGVDTPSNRRIGGAKSRSGCKTCKIRRVKCGEEKPTCLRCSSTGRKCHYECIGMSPMTLSPPTGAIPSHTLSLFQNTGHRERRAFEYYFKHAARHLAGGMGIDFWTGVVPQICRSEPAVWDAMIAISALFEYPDQCLDFTRLRDPYKKPNTLCQTQQEALVWYSRSMATIHSQIERGSADPYIALISCVLFICIETVQGRMEEALQLYGQGVSLILDLHAQVGFGGVSSTKAALLEHTIIPLFLRLGTNSLTISGIQPSELFALAELDTDLTFTSVDSARSAITLLAAETIVFEREATMHLRAGGGEDSVSPEMLEQKRFLQARLAQWHRAYTNLCQNICADSKFSTATEPVLLTYHAAASISLTGSLIHRQSVYDAHLEDFAVIVEQATVTLGASAGPDGAQPPFTFEMGVGVPLFLTVMKCRDPGLRRRALALLRQAPPVQGFFKCTPVALLAENLMRLEEDFSRAIREAKAPELDDSLAHTNYSNGLSTSLHPHSATNSMLIPEEARVSFCGVFRYGQPLPPGIAEEDIAKWGREPGQLFLEFARNRFDSVSNTWVPVSQCVPLES